VGSWRGGGYWPPTLLEMPLQQEGHQTEQWGRPPEEGSAAHTSDGGLPPMETASPHMLAGPPPA